MSLSQSEDSQIRFFMNGSLTEILDVSIHNSVAGRSFFSSGALQSLLYDGFSPLGTIFARGIGVSFKKGAHRAVRRGRGQHG